MTIKTAARCAALCFSAAAWFAPRICSSGDSAECRFDSSPSVILDVEVSWFCTAVAAPAYRSLSITRHRLPRQSWGDYGRRCPQCVSICAGNRLARSFFHTTSTILAKRLHFTASREHDAWDYLADITAPTLVIHGSDDELTPAENADLGFPQNA